MFARNSRHLAAASLLCLISLLSTPAWATITIGGDPGQVWPPAPSDWSSGGNSGTVYVGYGAGKTGTVTATGGSHLLSSDCWIANGPGSFGTITVDGLGSTFNSSQYGHILYVGAFGAGTLNVQNKGKVYSTWSYLGYGTGSNGAAIVTGTGSTWTNDYLYWGKNGQGTGTLTVSNGGQVTTNQYASITGATGISSTATVTGANSIWTVTHGLGVAAGNTLTVASGGTVVTGFIQADLISLKGDGTINAKGLISDVNLVFDAAHGTNQVFAFGAGGALNLCVDGTGMLGVGLNGDASMRIADGAKIASSDGFLGEYTGSVGTATVTGKGSTWNAGALWVGNWGNGTLTVGGGAMVTAPKVAVGIINSSSTVNLHISGDSMLVLGNGTTTGSVANIGSIDFYADAFLTPKAYSPITEFSGKTMTWSGTGSYNGYGGVWDGTAKTFIVAAATTSDSAAANTLTTGERLLITDSATGKRVGASFGTVAGGTNFSAAVLSGADLSGLPADQTVLGAWNFTTNFAGDQALLSFDIGAGQMGTLSVWHYDGSTWTPFAAPDLTYGEDGIANFAVTSFSGYAITAAVPEPCSLALLVMSGMALLRRRAR